jgi:alpha-D-xyloside xylohydrolase
MLSGHATEALSMQAPDIPNYPSTSWMKVMPGIWKTTIGRPEAITPVRSRLVEPMTKSLATMQAMPHAPLPVPVAKVTHRGVEVEFPLAAGEQIYGFGLQFFAVQHRAKRRVIRVNADPRVDTGDSHAPVPFYVSNKGYGILDCGETRPKPLKASEPVGGGVVPLYTKTLGDEQTSQILAEVPNVEGIEVYLFGGPTMLDAVRRYNLFSGGGVMPPDWGLGFWYRTESNATDQAVTAIATEFRERRIPCDVIGLEAGWQTHAYSCTFAWHKERFPDPPTFVNGIRRMDYHVNLWEHAFTHPSSPLFTPMRDLAGDKGVWGGLVPDFQDPQARRVFGEYHGKALLDIGIDGFKLDECDNSDYTGGWSFAELSQFPSGVDGEQMHNIFGLRYQRTLWDQFQQRKRPTYGLVRSSGALAAPYPFVLYSDLYDHRQFVRALVNSGFSGLLWCPEVRDAKSDEDLIRRLQVVVFSPLAMINGWYIANPTWKQLDRRKNNANELTPDWQQLEARCREILGWRMQIIPYLRAAFAKYATDGTPPFRALALDWPDKPELARIDDAWMIGDRMLVAPLFAGEPAGRSLLLPPGDWHNFWTGERIAAGTKLQIVATEKNIPVFIKSGAVLPLAAITNSTADPESRKIKVRVFGDGQMTFELHTAEGHSLSLKWNAASKVGEVKQSGPAPYSVTGWSV